MAADFTSFQNSRIVLGFFDDCELPVPFTLGAGGGGAIGGGGAGGAPGTGGGGGGGPGGIEPDGGKVRTGAVNLLIISISSAEVKSVKSNSETIKECWKRKFLVNHHIFQTMKLMTISYK